MRMWMRMPETTRRPRRTERRQGAARQPMETRPVISPTGPALGHRPSAPPAAAAASQRFLIEAVTPEIEGGRFAAKRVRGDRLEVFADLVCDGHVVADAALLTRAPGAAEWHRTPMRFQDNDRWRAEIELTDLGLWHYTIEAWIDPFQTWRRDLQKKTAAGVPVGVDLLEGRALVEQAHRRAKGPGKKALKTVLDDFAAAGDGDLARRLLLLTAPALLDLMIAHGPRLGLTRYPRDLALVVDPPIARTAAWYEMFWRSQGSDPARGATIDDCIARLPYVRDLGFDVVYLVPIHPIGRTNRKGRNNSLAAGPDDPGSPYAIGAAEGGHTAVHPDWGTLEDFRRFVAEAKGLGMEVALDFAIQCSPDHPWITQHPDWFDWRPDGTIKYAENPPKKYEDIVNVEFYGPHWKQLWAELRDIVQFWIDQGVSHFRVDNPHTKPLPFWQWLIADIKSRHPDTVFLSEAFTRPKLMKALAKVGFSQSYSYFTWRNTKDELTEYLEELTQGPARDYMRANFFPTTPDILPKALQDGGRPAHLIRLTLAATLSSLYGLYNGYELCEATPVPGKEEFLNSEKYQHKVWDWDRPGHIKDWVRALNRIRRENPALQLYESLRFYHIDNPNILLYGKITPDRANFVLAAVNLDPFQPQEGHLDLPLWELGLADWDSVAMEELLTGHRFVWSGRRQHLWIDNTRPAFLWRVTPTS